MGGSTSKPAPPPPPPVVAVPAPAPPPPPVVAVPAPPPQPSLPPPSDFAIDVNDDVYEIPADIKDRLVGTSEVKRYLADDPVMEWLATLPDEYDENAPLHPFIDALHGLCHGAGIRTTLITGAIRGQLSLRNPSAVFFAFDERGYIAGFSVTSIDPDHPDEVYREVTCTGLRRKGYGKMLDAAVIAYARELGKVRIRLEPSDSTARAIHTAMGFRPIDRTSMVKDVPPLGGGRRLRRTRKRSFLRKNKQWTRHR